MKRFFFFSFILFFQFNFYKPLHAGSIVKVGIYNNTPLIFIDAQKRGKGIFADILEYVADKEGWQIQYVPGTWRQCLSRLEINKIDILCTIAFSKDRNRRYDFSKENLLTSWGQIYTQKYSQIKTLTDLSGKKIAVLNKDIHSDAFNNIMKNFGITCRIITTDDYQSVLDLVSRGKADAGVVNRFFGMKYGEKYAVDKSGVIFNPIKINYAVPKGKNHPLLVSIDRHIKQLKTDKNSLYYQSLEKWFGAVSGKWEFPQWGKWGIIISLAGFLFFFLGSLILRDQVKSRTKDLAIELNRRKTAEAELRDSEKKYRDILENIDDGYFEVDMAGNFIFFNESMCQILGYPGNELMGMNNREYMDKKNAKKIYQTFNTVSKTGISTKALDWRLLKKDGSVCFVETIVSLMTDSNQKPVGFRGIARDITDRKQLEDQLRQSQKMESVGTLAGGIAHDFNNLLYMILGNTELALETLPENHPGHLNLEKIKAASLKAAGIIRQLLNFSRKTELDLNPVDITMVVEDALDFLRSTLPATIDINKNIPDKKIIVFADPVQINQVLMNICINASQAMEETGGSLEINIEKQSITPYSALNSPDLNPGEHVIITISDTGPGISPSIVDRIFDPYFTTKEIGKGSGMGLAVVQGIVKSHNGGISVASQPGKGTVFTILFPIIDREPATGPEMADEPPPVGNETILFVDDEETIADMIGQILEQLGYNVETRTNPRDALKLFQSNVHDFDLVITDMTMPQMTGIELSKELKTVCPDIPVIICSGHSSLMDGKKAAQLGIAAYVMKPVSMLEIAKAIRKVLDTKITEE